MGLKEWLIPQEKIFFNWIEEESQLVLKAAEIFNEMMQNFNGTKEKVEKLKEIEHECDEILHNIFDKLNKTFITPIDHEDISNLTSLYDDVLDMIESVAKKILLFKIKKPDTYMKKAAGIILECVKEVNFALKDIRKMDETEIRKKFVIVHRLENEMDDLKDESIAKLFEEKDPVKIIILKDIYESLEIITDKCEDVCLAIQDIVIKNT
jgi:predicted phosphate transport protein (TIGR00153 family)